MNNFFFFNWTVSVRVLNTCCRHLAYNGHLFQDTKHVISIQYEMNVLDDLAFDTNRFNAIQHKLQVSICWLCM